uniref:Uncharacterized protein n=1 Tax=Panagrolaimus davidi TaxID=227884 RepID=A0A914P5W1_9BILA
MKTLHFYFAFIFSALAVNAFVYHQPPIDEGSDTSIGQPRERRQSDDGWDWNNNGRKKRESEFNEVEFSNELIQEAIRRTNSELDNNGKEEEISSNYPENEIETNADDKEHLQKSELKNMKLSEYPKREDDVVVDSDEEENDGLQQHKSLKKPKKKCKKGKKCKGKGEYGGNGGNGRRCYRDMYGNKRCIGDVIAQAGTGIIDCLLGKMTGQPCHPQQGYQQQGYQQQGYPPPYQQNLGGRRGNRDYEYYEE